MSQRMPVLCAATGRRNLSDRVRESTRARASSSDKLMALGKLSAGLAHELNNPAAAARRAATNCSARLKSLRAADLACAATTSRPSSARSSRSSSGPPSRGARTPEPLERARAERPRGRAHSVARRSAESGKRLGHGVTRWPRRAWNEAASGAVARRGRARKSSATCSHASRHKSDGANSCLTSRREHESHLGTGRGDQRVLLHGSGAGQRSGRAQRAGEHALILKHKLKKKNIPVVSEYAEDFRASRRTAASSIRCGRTSSTTRLTRCRTAGVSGADRREAVDVLD